MYSSVAVLSVNRSEKVISGFVPGTVVGSWVRYGMRDGGPSNNTVAIPIILEGDVCVNLIYYASVLQERVYHY